MAACVCKASAAVDLTSRRKKRRALRRHAPAALAKLRLSSVSSNVDTHTSNCSPCARNPHNDGAGVKPVPSPSVAVRFRHEHAPRIAAAPRAAASPRRAPEGGANASEGALTLTGWCRRGGAPRAFRSVVRRGAPAPCGDARTPPGKTQPAAAGVCDDATSATASSSACRFADARLRKPWPRPRRRRRRRQLRRRSWLQTRRPPRRPLSCRLRGRRRPAAA